ncbi:hypothetical protein J6590_036158 [Homalodisca vitripennis]|nr:hypothetical protein J6590_036158 [Homalodisca vitripennis]
MARVADQEQDNWWLDNLSTNRYTCSRVNNSTNIAVTSERLCKPGGGWRGWLTGNRTTGGWTIVFLHKHRQLHQRGYVSRAVDGARWLTREQDNWWLDNLSTNRYLIDTLAVVKTTAQTSPVTSERLCKPGGGWREVADQRTGQLVAGQLVY